MLIGAEALRAASLPPAARDALGARTTEIVPVEVAGIPCAVHFDDAHAAAQFARRYVDLATAAPPLRHAYALAHAGGEPLFWSGAGLVYRWPHGAIDAAAIAFLADAVAITGFFRERSDALSFHAAAVGIDGAAAALVGDSRAGKSTTAIACARSGMRLYSDERCVVVDDRVAAFPRAVNIRAGGAALLLGDGVRDDSVATALRAHGPGDWDHVRFRTLFTAWEPPPRVPLRSVFLIAGAAAHASLTRATRFDAVRAAAQWTHCAGDRLDAVGRLLHAFRGAACYRLVLGAPSETAALVVRTLTTDAHAFVLRAG